MISIYFFFKNEREKYILKQRDLKTDQITFDYL